LVDLCPPIEPYQVTKNQKYLPALIPTLTGIIVGYLMCPPQVAEILSAIVAVYIIDQGLDKFCQNCSDS
ncbi:hypothetical protein H0902_07480, partial [Microcystis aeruginosa BLCCF108]|nr:hypothetical protein [Microcystis aeruginosa BLCC-F108]